MLFQVLEWFSRASDFFCRSDTWSKKWWVIFWIDGPKHIKLNTVDIILYLHTDTDTCMHMYIDCWWYSKTCLMRPLKKEDQKLVFKTDYRLMQVKSIAECSKGNILQSFRPSFSYHLLLRSLFVHRLTVRWILLSKWDFFTTKKDGSTGATALESDGPYFEIMGQWPGPTINLKAWILQYFSKHV